MVRFKKAIVPGRWISTCGRFTIRPAVEGNAFVMVDLTTGGHEMAFNLKNLKQHAARLVEFGGSLSVRDAVRH